MNEIIKLKKKQQLNDLKISVKKSTKTNLVQHTLKFGSLFAPHSLKEISLLFRNSTKYNSLLVNKPNKKILVKQSYIFLIWISYLSQSGDSTTSDKKEGKSKSGCPSFFIYPFRNYKTTITKAPMAHKTYSQEQFMMRFYKFSISFYSNNSVSGHFGDKSYLSGLDKILYFSHFVRRDMPYVGTNMLFLSKYTVVFYSIDSSFFSFFSNSNKILQQRLK